MNSGCDVMWCIVFVNDSQSQLTQGNFYLISTNPTKQCDYQKE